MQHDSNILKLRWAMSHHAHEVRSVKFDLSDMTGEDKLGFQTLRKNVGSKRPASGFFLF